MSRTQYGWIATVAGAAMAATWWWRRRDWVAEGMSQGGENRGTTIFTNSPEVS